MFSSQSCTGTPLKACSTETSTSLSLKLSSRSEKATLNSSR